MSRLIILMSLFLGSYQAHAYVSNWVCDVTGDNDGCEKTIRCPAGYNIANVRAACNLEWGKVTAKQLNDTQWSTIRVVRESDNRANSSCSVGKPLFGTQAGESPIYGFLGRETLDIRCKEHDNNGGDCHMRVQLYCKRDVVPPKNELLLESFDLMDSSTEESDDY